MFSYSCPRGHDTIEKYVKRHDEVVLCDKCNAVMTKVLNGDYRISMNNPNLKAGKRLV